VKGQQLLEIGSVKNIL